MTESEVTEAINKWIKSLNQKDFDTFYEIENESFGYGWRGGTFRDTPTDKEQKKHNLMGFLNSVQLYQCRFEPSKIEVIGDTALVCGNYIEDITNQDDSIIQNNVRTSMTWIKRQGKWKLMQYHRDTQFT
jgi:ketosteroid isomerase-like protein